MPNEEIDPTESTLREAFEKTGLEDDTVNMDALRSRAQRELHIKDLVSFGFSHVLRTVLALLSGLYNRIHQPPSERS